MSNVVETAGLSESGPDDGLPVVRFLNLSVDDPKERASLLAATERVFDHGRLVLGPEVESFEQRVAEFCGKRYCVGLNTGTDALILGLKALGIGEGDEVITTPLSWLATGSAILLNGATAVFGDVDETLNIDPASIEPLITSRTKAILAVHFTGQLARMPEIVAIARRHGLFVIEDGAQSFGATLDGKPCGSFGDLACISMNPMKIFGALGDAGVALSDDEQVAERLDRLRHSGVVDRDYCLELSHNCRLDTLQAAYLLVRLDTYKERIEKRRSNARRYDTELEGVVRTPVRMDGYEDVHYTYPIRCDRRDELKDHLAKLAIETRVQHPVLMNHQQAFQGLVRGNSPRAEQLVSEILCLPVHEKLTHQEQTRVIEAIREFVRA